MSDIAIRVESLGKRYRIGEKQRKYSTLRDSIAGHARRITQRRPRAGEDAEDFWALKDVSFEVKQGEIVGVIGRNGAGKSTLLKILSRITEPTQGAVDLHGRVGSLLEVGTGFHPELSGRENIFLNGAILGMKRVEIRRKFDEIVEFAEIEKFLDTPVKHYSSGMYVRLAFAVAAHLEPEILLLDEVLAVGDTEFQRKCLGKIGEVSEGGRTVLFVSHNMSAIEHLCQTVVTLGSGRLIGVGPSTEVIAQYLGHAKSSGDGDTDYSNNPARAWNFASLIKRLRLLDEHGIVTRFHYPGSEITFELTIVTPALLRSPRILIALEDSMGRRLTTFGSHFMGSNLPLVPGENVVKCVVPTLPFGRGTYLISVSVGDATSGLLDSIDSSASFEIGWRNNYGNGESFNHWYGPILTAAKWQIIKQDQDFLVSASPGGQP